MDEKDTSNQSVHMEEQSSNDHAMAVSKAVANYEEAQHTQTKIAAIKENWKGLGWCKYLRY